MVIILYCISEQWLIEKNTHYLSQYLPKDKLFVLSTFTYKFSNRIHSKGYNYGYFLEISSSHANWLSKRLNSKVINLIDDIFYHFKYPKLHIFGNYTVLFTPLESVPYFICYFSALSIFKIWESHGRTIYCPWGISCPTVIRHLQGWDI